MDISLSWRCSILGLLPGKAAPGHLPGPVGQLVAVGGGHGGAVGGGVVAPAHQGPVGHGEEGRGAPEGKGQGGQYLLPVVHGVEGR